MPVKIVEALSTEEISRCFPVMKQLRTHFDQGHVFVAQVERQRGEGYRLVYLEDGGEIQAVAGFRILESLFSGRFCYVDDLVTSESGRSLGYGSALFDWLVATAQEAGCRRLELDSGVQRFGAHRFYLHKRMMIASHHFALDLELDRKAGDR
jgi:GNAT superfamily N-acetyltransferase